MRVAVLGVGLIGGSIGLAARALAAGETVVAGYDADPAVRDAALARGAISIACEDVAAAAAGADAVFVAVPVGHLAAVVEEALAVAPSDCVVSDVGSTKRVVARFGAVDEQHHPPDAGRAEQIDIAAHAAAQCGLREHAPDATARSAGRRAQRRRRC